MWRLEGRKVVKEKLDNPGWYRWHVEIYGNVPQTCKLSVLKRVHNLMQFTQKWEFRVVKVS